MEWIREACAPKGVADCILIIYGCANSIKAEVVNSSFEELLGKYKVEPEVLSLYYYILENKFSTNEIEREQEKGQLKSVLNNISNKIQDLDDKLLAGELPAHSYNRLINSLESQRLEFENRYDLLNKSASEYENTYNIVLRYWQILLVITKRLLW